MSSHLVTIDGRYPLGISPWTYGSVTLFWKFIVFLIWIALTFNNEANFLVATIVAIFPEFTFLLYLIKRNKDYGWIITPVINTIQTAGMLKEAKPLYRTIFGYNKIEVAPSFYLDSFKKGEYTLSFEPNGCPNATVDLLPILQQEIKGYEITPKHGLNKLYIIRKRKIKGKVLNNEDFFCD